MLSCSKRFDFKFPIVTFLFLCRHLQVSQLVCYARTYCKYQDFIDTRISRSEGCVNILKVLWEINYLVYPCNVDVSKLISDLTTSVEP